MEYNKEAEEKFENGIFDIVASIKEDDDEMKKRGLMLFCTEALAMRKFLIDHHNPNGEPIDMEPFFDSFREDRYNSKLSVEEWYDKYFKKDMIEERHNKVLEMITYLRETSL